MTEPHEERQSIKKSAAPDPERFKERAESVMDDVRRSMIVIQDGHYVDLLPSEIIASAFAEIAAERDEEIASVLEAEADDLRAEAFRTYGKFAGRENVYSTEAAVLERWAEALRAHTIIKVKL